MGLFNRKAEVETVETTTAVTDIAGDYALDPTHTRIGFSARHAMVTKVRGQFDEFEG
ncbi:MAG: YceI family protein, partial [Intrasporangium sp.]|uniref:YceI family protein n=1 Tax=Intrasporangium sp. TaxID=1925024 RepID=UPI003F7E1AA4